MKEQISQKEHKRIKTAYNAGAIVNLRPLWHWEKPDIDFKKQGDEINDDLFSEGYSIIEVDLANLISKFDLKQGKMFNLKKLYNGMQEPEKISGVVKKWLNQEALIPPIILCRDSSISKFVEDSDVLMPQDGKHRINVAYSYGDETIPIIIMNKQSDKLKRILGIQ